MGQLCNQLQHHLAALHPQSPGQLTATTHARMAKVQSAMAQVEFEFECVAAQVLYLAGLQETGHSSSQGARDRSATDSAYTISSSHQAMIGSLGKEVFVKIAETFVKQGRLQLQRLQKALLMRMWVVGCLQAHALKGIALAIASESLISKAKELQIVLEQEQLAVIMFA